VNWFRDRAAIAEHAVAKSEEALAEAEKARAQAKKSADYLRKERARNHFSEDVRAVWEGRR
jgi:hypothetical protein